MYSASESRCSFVSEGEVGDAIGVFREIILVKEVVKEFVEKVLSLLRELGLGFEGWVDALHG